MPALIDISVPLSNEIPVWTGSHGVHISRLQDMQKGDIANVSRLDLDIHSGTHIDAPLHFVADGKTTDEIPLNRLVGPCYVADLRGKPFLDRADMEAIPLPEGTKRLLLKTDNSRRWLDPTHSFSQDFCALTANAAQWVIERGIELIGIDYHSIQRFQDPPDTHQILLRKEVIILEGLNLGQVEAGSYRLICLPLKIQGVEGASARAVLEIPDTE